MWELYLRVVLMQGSRMTCVVGGRVITGGWGSGGGGG